MLHESYLVYSLLYVLPILGVFGIAALVLLRSGRQNIEFCLFSLALGLWLLLQFLAQLFSDDHELSVFLLRSAVAVSTPTIAIALVLFANKYSGYKASVLNKVCMVLSVLLVPFLLTPLVVADASITHYGIAITVGPVYYLQILVIVIAVVDVVRKLIRYAAENKGNNARVTSTRYLIFAFAQVVIINVIAGFFFADSEASQAIVPLTCLIMVVIIAFTIARHRLFDIRLIVARALAYALSIGVLASVYGLLASVVIGSLIFTDSTSVLTQQIVYTVLAVVLAFTFQPLKRFFDKLSNRLFYQDAYEAQSLLNDLNASLVASIDVNAIIKNTSLLLEHYLKPEYVGFYVYKTDKMPSKLFITDQTQNTTIEDVWQLCQRTQDKIINVSDTAGLSADAQHIAVAKNMAMIAQLASAEHNDQTVGAIVLGQKKSGSLYGVQDYRVMEIIADELVIAIQNALRFEEIQQFNVTLQEKVDDATRQLRGVNQKLVAMDQTKDDFISMASHQLRTPLTSVKGYVSMVMEGDVGKITKEQRKLLDQAFLSSQRMVYLISDLLNVSRLKTGKFIIESKPTNLPDVVEGELEQLKETAAARKLDLQYNKPKDFPVLNLDETKIRQVIMNFVDNSIYYTPSGGHIQVSLVDKGETIEFTVTDDGIGVPRAEQHKLFTKFYRAGNAKKARPDGTGLGLFMARKVVIAQGGAIIFKATEGKGSTFGFSFEKKKLTAGIHSVSVDDVVDVPKQDLTTEVQKANKT